jgi:hypothetical protein
VTPLGVTHFARHFELCLNVYKHSGHTVLHTTVVSPSAPPAHVPLLELY